MATPAFIQCKFSLETQPAMRSGQALPHILADDPACWHPKEDAVITVRFMYVSMSVSVYNVYICTYAHLGVLYYIYIYIIYIYVAVFVFLHTYV